MALWPIDMSTTMVGILPVFDPPHLHLAKTNTHTHTQRTLSTFPPYFILLLSYL